MPRKNVVRLTDRPDMTIAVYCGRKIVNELKLDQIQVTFQVLCSIQKHRQNSVPYFPIFHLSPI